MGLQAYPARLITPASPDPSSLKGAPASEGSEEVSVVSSQWGEPFRRLTLDSHVPHSGIVSRFNRYCAHTDFRVVDECSWFTQ